MVRGGGREMEKGGGKGGGGEEGEVPFAGSMTCLMPRKDRSHQWKMEETSGSEENTIYMYIELCP